MSVIFACERIEHLYVEARAIAFTRLPHILDQLSPRTLSRSHTPPTMSHGCENQLVAAAVARIANAAIWCGRSGTSQLQDAHFPPPSGSSFTRSNRRV